MTQPIAHHTVIGALPTGFTPAEDATGNPPAVQARPAEGHDVTHIAEWHDVARIAPQDLAETDVTDLQQEVLRLRTQATAQASRASVAEDQRAQAVRQAAEAREYLGRFKRQVRELALRTKSEEGWCRSGFNEAMEELGLEPLPNRYEVEVTVTATRTVTLTIDAEDLADDVDEDAVAEVVRQSMTDEVAQAADLPDDWEITETDVGTVDALTD